MRCPLLKFVFLLLLATPPVWASPDTTMTVSPSATSGTTITASDENSRNNSISTAFNTHSHTDVSQTANTLNVGDGTAGTKSICANAADATDLCIRWDDTNNLWTAEILGDTTAGMLLKGSGTAGLLSNAVLLGGGTSSITAVASLGTAGQVLTSNGASSAPTFQTGAPVVVADRVYRTAGDVSTTSTSLVNFTGASITLTTGANPALVGWAASCVNDTGNANTNFNVDVDGSLVLGTTGLSLNEAVISEGFNASFVAMTSDLTAASHTFKLQWSVVAGSGTCSCNTSTACNFWVQEVTD